jgi:FkbM family methyltransferase
MKSYGQNAEDLFLMNYFKGEKGIILDLGANDGTTFSNSKLLIENGWKAHLIEPSYVCNQLALDYMANHNVRIYKIAIGTKNTWMTLHESHAHVPGGADRALVSSLKEEETLRWKAAGVQYQERQVEVQTFKTWLKSITAKWPLKFDVISIDVEGMEYPILKQMDLEALGCRVLIIEWNGRQDLYEKFVGYCKGYRLAIKNNENLIFVK